MVEEITHYNIAGNMLETWTMAVGIFLFSFFIFKLFRTYIVRRISSYLGRFGGIGGDMLSQISDATRTTFLLVVSLYLSTQVLQLPGRVETWIARGTLIFFIIQLCIWANVALTVWFQDYAEKQAATDLSRATTLRVLLFVVRIIALALIVLWGLDNLGVNITTLVAGLGVGGVAVALAVQNILGDLIASFTIVLDKPFVVGDFIVVGNYSGTVEKVGIKTTRLRSLSGEQLIFPNADLLQSKIQNFKRMRERRVVFKIGVTYQTSLEQVRSIPQLIRNLIEKQSKVRFERSHFQGFGASTLDFETVYWILDPDYNPFMDTHQAVLFGILEAFNSAKIEFAYPTQTLFVSQVEEVKDESSLKSR